MNKTELRKILAELLEINESEISDSVILSELGLDSIKFINFVVKIENEYNIEIYDSDLETEKFKNIDAIYTTLQKYFNDTKQIYKCAITDCDGVMWRGISGESGIDKAYFDKHTMAIGQLLSDLRQRGVLLAICSKNELKNIEFMLDNENFPLSTDDFVIVDTECVNKAETVYQIISEIGFFAEQVIFLDDSDYEIGLIGKYLPEVKAVKAAYDESFVDEFSKLFENLPENSDVDRTTQFREQKEREKIHIHSSSPEEYNLMLDTVVMCGDADEADIARMAELSERTNRFNMTGCRYTEEKIHNILKDKNYHVYTLKAFDKYGDMGLVAMAVVYNDIIENFMLSCRVFGRDFEKVLLEKIRSNTVGYCAAGMLRQIKTVIAVTFIKTMV